MLLILVELELDPLAVGVTMAVEPDQVLGSQLHLAVSVQPTWRLGEPHGTKANDAREQQLKTDWDHPRRVASDVEPASGSTARNQGADGPHDVVKTGDDTTVGRVGDFDDVDGTGSGSDTDTEAEEEAASHELVDTGVDVGGELDDDADDDDPGANCHANSSTPCVDEGTDKGNGDDGSDLVHGGDNT